MLPTEEARLRRWPRHDCAPSGCAPTHAICWRPRNPHRPRPTKQRPSSPRFPPCEAFERRPPAARPTVVQGAGVRNPSAEGTAGVDVNRTLRIAAVDVAVGRKARLSGSLWEGPESEPEPSFHCKREIAFTARSPSSSPPNVGRDHQFSYFISPVWRSTLSRCTSEFSTVTISAVMDPSSAVTSPSFSRLFLRRSS